MAAVLAAGLPLLSGCYFDNEAKLYGAPAPCDAPTVTYLANVGPVLNTHCLACHGTTTYANLGGNLNLATYAGVKAVADNGVLLKSIKHEAGASEMPKNSPMLSACDIEIISKWVAAGALNN